MNSIFESLVLGLAMGVALVFALEWLDKSLKGMDG